MNKATPVVLLVIVLIVAGASFFWFVGGPTGTSGHTQGTYNSTTTIVLYANAQGWNYNSTPNPTLNEKFHTRLDFKVIEQDGLPHTLTINPGPNESSSQSDYIVNVQIPTTVGAVVWVNWSFSSTGLYTYWCTVHPVTMVGKLYVNSTSNNSTAALPAVPIPLTSSLAYQSTFVFEASGNDEQAW